MPQAIWIFQGQITESHWVRLLEKVDLTEDNASKLQQFFSKNWRDANDKWNAMWGVKIERTKKTANIMWRTWTDMEDA